MAGVQIAGFTTANIAEVEANTKALRTVLRPEDYGALGIYSLAQTSGTMAAGLGAAAPIFAFRYPGSSLALVKRVLFSAGTTATAFTAGQATFTMFAARSFTASDTAGTDITPATNGNKLRTSMAASGVTGTGMVRISSTATLTAGTRTLDANPIGAITCGVPATAGQPIVMPGSILFDQRPGEHPLVLAINEGFVIQATVPATGTWVFSVKVDWAEVASY